MNAIRKYSISSLVWFSVAAVIGIQTCLDGKEFLRLLQTKVIANLQLDAIERSADVTYGSDYLGYIAFLRQALPSDAVVVNTKTFGLVQYDSTGFLQYFLFPRTVITLQDSSCPETSILMDCIEDMSGLDAYFIYGPNLSIDTSVPEGLTVLPFNSSSGLLAPIP